MEKIIFGGQGPWKKNKIFRERLFKNLRELKQTDVSAKSGLAFQIKIFIKAWKKTRNESYDIYNNRV